MKKKTNCEYYSTMVDFETEDEPFIAGIDTIWMGALKFYFDKDGIEARVPCVSPKSSYSEQNPYIVNNLDEFNDLCKEIKTIIQKPVYQKNKQQKYKDFNDYFLKANTNLVSKYHGSPPTLDITLEQNKALQGERESLERTKDFKHWCYLTDYTKQYVSVAFQKDFLDNNLHLPIFDKFGIYFAYGNKNYVNTKSDVHIRQIFSSMENVDKYRLEEILFVMMFEKHIAEIDGSDYLNYRETAEKLLEDVLTSPFQNKLTNSSDFEQSCREIEQAMRKASCLFWQPMPDEETIEMLGEVNYKNYFCIDSLEMYLQDNDNNSDEDGFSRKLFNDITLCLKLPPETIINLPWKSCIQSFKYAFKINNDIFNKLNLNSFKLDWDKKIKLLDYILESHFNGNQKIEKWFTDFIIKALKEASRQKEIEHQKEVTAAKLAERDQILSDLSHSIKNILPSSIIDPLVRLQKQVDPENTATIERALKGADLIGRLVESINNSSSGCFEDFVYDANNKGEGAISLHNIIYNSIFFSIGNIFYARNSSKLRSKYFLEDRDLESKVKDAMAAIEPNNLKQLAVFCNQYLFDCDFMINGLDKYILSDSKGSAMKMLILFQEIIFNAVKYSRLVKRDQRFLNISIVPENNKFLIEIKNSASSKFISKDTGLGQVIIEKMAGLMNAKYNVIKNDDSYCVKMEIPNFWNQKKIESKQIKYTQENDQEYSQASEKEEDYGI